MRYCFGETVLQRRRDRSPPDARWLNRSIPKRLAQSRDNRGCSAASGYQALPRLCLIKTPRTASPAVRRVSKLSLGDRVAFDGTRRPERVVKINAPSAPRITSCSENPIHLQYLTAALLLANLLWNVTR